MSDLPARLALLRSKSGLTAVNLGKLAGLSHGTVGMIEGGKRENPASNTVKALAEVLGDSAGWLLFGVGDPPSEEQVRAAVAAAQAGQTSDSGEHPATPDSESDAEAS